MAADNAREHFNNLIWYAAVFCGCGTGYFASWIELPIWFPMGVFGSQVVWYGLLFWRTQYGR